MSATGVLYMKGMNVTDSDDDMDEEDIWDDTKLNDAYDKALRMANLEVAKRVALSTNSGEPKKEKAEETPGPQPISPKSTTVQKISLNKSSKLSKEVRKEQKKEAKAMWREGMPCRARYDEDGFEYEAIVLTILDDENCVIKYLGYNNTEIVPVCSLQPTLGKEARKDQMLEAIAEGGKAEELTPRSSLADLNLETTQPTHEVNGVSPSSNRHSRKNKKSAMDKCFQMPNIPMPDFSMLKEFGEMEMPMPPPPLLGSHDEDQELSNMLVSWYMSGYYTGLYQGMKRAKAHQSNC